MFFLKKKFFYFGKWNFLGLSLKNVLYFLWKFFYQLKKSFSTLNKTRLGQTGCLSNLYYLLATQASSFLIHLLSQTKSTRTWLVGSPHCAAYLSLRRHHSTPFVTMCFPQQIQLGHTWQPFLTVQPMCVS